MLTMENITLCTANQSDISELQYIFPYGPRIVCYVKFLKYFKISNKAVNVVLLQSEFLVGNLVTEHSYMNKLK